MREQLFFELIRVAIGSQDMLSRPPLAEEWKQLYDMAKKQSLVGICFAAVQRLPEEMRPPEMLYITWMGMAAKIQQRNEVVNRQCVKLQAKLAGDGLRSAILKGQGVASLYDEHLRGLRQSGDIDVWVNAPKDKVVAWAEKVGITEPAGYLHVGTRCFEDPSTGSGEPTEVELHYRPTYCRCLWYNKRLQEFCDAHRDDWSERNGIVVSSWKFDVVYQLSHIYRHLFGLGIGLRQLMDYYFVLRAADEGRRTKDEELTITLKDLGLYDFAGAVMYVLREVFHMDEQFMIVPVDERRGRMLLDMVMQTGNFGHQDEIQREARSTAVGNIKYKVKQWWQLVRLYPEETLSAPLWSLMRKFD